MQKIHNLLFCFFLLSSLSLIAQIEGDAVFAEDQIITVELEFSQPGFFDSLLLNYETADYMKADLTLTDNTGTTVLNEVGVRLKGNSTFNHPNNKKAFKIDINEYVSGQNYDGLKKLNFSNGFKDPTLLREKIFFDAARAAGAPAPRANFANVYFNGELWGFYTVVEQIDDQFLDWRILDDDGNLFKAGDNFGGGPQGGGNAADLQWYGTDQEEYAERYELKSNEDENDWSDLIDLIDYIDNSSQADFTAEFDTRFEAEEHLTSAALDNIFSNLDSYTGSARNYYLYHNLTTDKWEWIKWDANETFGSYGGGGPGGGGQNNMTTLEIDYRDDNRPLLDKVFNSPELFARYQNAMCVILNNHFSPEMLNPKIDALRDLVQSSVYADNNKQYSNADFDNNIENNITTGGGPGGGGTTYGLKSFISARYNFLTSEADCTTAVQNAEFFNVKLSPNPTSDILQFAEGLTEVVVYNVFGQEVLQQKERAVNITVSDLTAGSYILTALNENGARVAGKFVKM